MSDTRRPKPESGDQSDAEDTLSMATSYPILRVFHLINHSGSGLAKSLL
jgi:hypothetical protein